MRRPWWNTAFRRCTPSRPEGSTMAVSPEQGLRREAGAERKALLTAYPPPALFPWGNQGSRPWISHDQSLTVSGLLRAALLGGHFRSSPDPRPICAAEGGILFDHRRLLPHTSSFIPHTSSTTHDPSRHGAARDSDHARNNVAPPPDASLLAASIVAEDFQPPTLITTAEDRTAHPMCSRWTANTLEQPQPLEPNP